MGRDSACQKRQKGNFSESILLLPATVLRLRALSVPAAEAEVPLDVGALDYRLRLFSFFASTTKVSHRDCRLTIWQFLTGSVPDLSRIILLLVSEELFCKDQSCVGEKAHRSCAKL